MKVAQGVHWGRSSSLLGEWGAVSHLAEVEGSRLASSIPEPRAAIPAPSQCHIAVGAAQPLLAALCRWGSTVNAIDVIAPNSRPAT